jgi:hypothetical protein
MRRRRDGILDGSSVDTFRRKKVIGVLWKAVLRRRRESGEEIDGRDLGVCLLDGGEAADVVKFEYMKAIREIVLTFYDLNDSPGEIKGRKWRERSIRLSAIVD